MRIQVLHHFSGKESQERTIAPGEYDTDDPALYKLGAYLVENGHAIEVEASPIIVTSQWGAVEEADTDLNSLTTAAASFEAGAAFVLIERAEMELDTLPTSQPKAKPKGKR